MIHSSKVRSSRNFPERIGSPFALGTFAICPGLFHRFSQYFYDFPQLFGFIFARCFPLFFCDSLAGRFLVDLPVRGLKVKPLADGQHNKDLYTHPIWTAVKCGDLATVDQIVKEDLARAPSAARFSIL